MSAAIAFQGGSVGAEELSVLAPRALRARTPLRQERPVRPFVSPAAQARTRLQERQRVSPAGQVRDACDMMAAYVYYPT